MTKGLLTIIVLLHTVCILYSQGKIDSSVIGRYDSQDSVSCFLIMEEQADIPHIPEDLAKHQKGELVFDALFSVAQSTQPPIIDFLKNHNLQYESFYIVNAVLVKIDKANLLDIVQHSSLSKVLPNFTTAIPQTRNALDDRSSEYLNWAIEKIGADSVWAMDIRGQNIVIGGQDTGYEWSHYLLKSKYRGYHSENFVDHSYNWYDAIQTANALHQDNSVSETTNPCGFSSPTPCDDNGHGTHTMGIILGSSENTISGIAPEAKWIGTRVMDRGFGQLSTYLAGLQWFLAPTDSTFKNPSPPLAPHVINNSWACPQKEGCEISNYWMIDSAISRLNQSGIFVVSSAGNEGREGCNTIKNPPAIFKNGLTVGATNRNDSIADFSSKGTWPAEYIKPDIVAPGVAINSAYLNGTTRPLSGTSMSGPVVTGVVALMISANPDLAGKTDKIRQILQMSTLEIKENACGPDESPNPVYGYGRIDALKAVQNAIKVTTPANQSIKQKNISLFPNPVSTQLWIDLKENYREIKIRILDSNGQVLFSKEDQNTSEVQLRTVSLKSGIYFVSIQYDGKSEVKKLIKL